MMKMSELILAIGDDNVEFQNLDQCAEKLNMNGGATRITFATLRNITPQGTDKLGLVLWLDRDAVKRSEEHTSELQSLMRISYAVFCLKKKNKDTTSTHQA